MHSNQKSLQNYYKNFTYANFSALFVKQNAILYHFIAYEAMRIANYIEIT